MISRFSLLLSLTLFTLLSISQQRREVIDQHLFPQFAKGVILFKNGVKREVFINYNKITEELLVANGSVSIALPNTENETIDTIYADGRKFVRLENKFLEVKYHSPSTTLFVEFKCKTITYTSTQYLNYGDQTDNYKTEDRLGTKNYNAEPFVVYWIKADQTLFKVLRLKDLMKAFEKKKPLYKTYLKQHEVDFDDVEQVEEFVRYLDVG
ncbi:MAG: hypothetical protein ACFHWX_17515 [Bacteroidota bacterium]